ncbi:hypothetical protein EJB05_28882, partial [Eragrostis curvula]
MAQSGDVGGVDKHGAVAIPTVVVLKEPSSTTVFSSKVLKLCEMRGVFSSQVMCQELTRTLST